MNPHNDITQSDINQTTAIVVGASRGLGRGIATALAAAGAPVIAVARTEAALAELAAGHGDIRPEVADASDPGVAAALLERHNPGAVVVVAGATPPIGPLHELSWEAFSVNWHTDVRIAFEWLRAVLAKPLAPGSRVVVISSGAALQGSPLTGGYAGAKAAQRFITAYAQDEANRAGLAIAFTAVLPRITPLTGLGHAGVQAYAARNGQTEEAYVQQFGDPLSPAGAGAAVLELVARTQASSLAPAYLLTGAGLRELQ